MAEEVNPFEHLNMVSEENVIVEARLFLAELKASSAVLSGDFFRRAVKNVEQILTTLSQPDGVDSRISKTDISNAAVLEIKTLKEKVGVKIMLGKYLSELDVLIHHFGPADSNWSSRAETLKTNIEKYLQDLNSQGSLFPYSDLVNEAYTIIFEKNGAFKKL